MKTEKVGGGAVGSKVEPGHCGHICCGKIPLNPYLCLLTLVPVLPLLGVTVRKIVEILS